MIPTYWVQILARSAKANSLLQPLRRGKARIGITGGTSTPEVDLEEVRERIYALVA